MNTFQKAFVNLKKDNLLTYTYPFYSGVLIYILSYHTCSKYENPYIMLWFLFGMVPLMDFYMKDDLQNPTKDEKKIMKDQFKYKVPILIACVLDWAILIWGVNEVVNNEKQGMFYKIGLTYLLSILESMSINFSHEMNHKLSKWEKFLGTFMLSKNLYMHFLIEHNEGHHKNVSTDEDPASSKLNQTLFNFVPQSIKGGFFSAWNIENKTCKEKYGTIFTFKNKMIFFTASYVLIPFTIYYYFGFGAMFVQFIVAFLSVFHLETINYVEHYGLRRKKLEDGTYENVDITHSWNSSHRMSNYILFKLQRHSDHHENALKPYQILITSDKSPCLPTGYPGCLIMSHFPDVWFRLINPLVDSYNKKDSKNEAIVKSVQSLILKVVVRMNIAFFTCVLVQFTLNQYY